MEAKRNVYFDHLLRQCMSLDENDIAQSTLSEVVDDTVGNLLHYAVRYGSLSVIATLVQLGIEIDSLDPSGRTPLMIAVENQDLRVVTILLDAGANVDIVGRDGITVLQLIFHSQYKDHSMHEAFLLALQGQSTSTEELVHRLFNAGCLASHAAYSRNARVVEGLLRRGVDVNSTTGNDRTALHIAAARNEFEMVKMLVENGADVNAVDGNGTSALLSAALIGNDVMLTFLLDQGANVNIEQPSTGWTALFLVYKYSEPRIQQQFQKCAEILIMRGAVPRNSTTDAILDIANEKSHSYKSKILISHIAMQETLGISIVESLTGSSSSEKYHSRYPEFGKYHDLCQKTLNSTVFQSLKLLDLLTENERRMVVHVRNNDFILYLTQFCTQHSLCVQYPLFFKILNERVSKAIRVMNLENTAIPAICSIFNADCYPVARKIVAYLNPRDLEQFNTLSDS